MRVVGINGSPRKDGNTSILIRTVFRELEQEGVETELVHIGGRAVRGCVACYKCYERKDGKCAMDADPVNECIAAMAAADGIILGSPTYFTDVTSEMKALIDRAGLVCRASDSLLKRKAGAAVVAVRRAGATHAFDTMNHFFQISQMFVVGSIYWNMAVGRNIGEVEKDDEGMETMRVLGRNMAWLLKRISG